MGEGLGLADGEELVEGLYVGLHNGKFLTPGPMLGLNTGCPGP